MNESIAIDVEFLSLTKAFVSGLVLGGVYCAMLWFSVQRVYIARNPMLWLAATAVPRIAVPLASFYWVMDSRWERLLACLAGFVVARLAVQYWVKSAGTAQPAG